MGPDYIIVVEMLNDLTILLQCETFLDHTKKAHMLNNAI
jgi:hypothetical protein